MSETTRPILQPGAGSPAARALEAAQSPEPAPQPKPQPQQHQEPPAPEAPQWQEDGTMVIQDEATGKSQVITRDQFAQIVKSNSELERRTRELGEKAQATDELLSLVGQDPRRMQQLQAMYNHWQTGAALPAETFGFEQAPPRQNRYSDDDDDDLGFGSRRAPAPKAAETAETAELRRQLRELQGQLGQLNQQSQQTQQQQALERTTDSARKTLELYPFLKNNPRALEDAVHRVVTEWKSDQGRSVDSLSREVAGVYKDILTQEHDGMLNRAKQGGAMPLRSAEGMPAPSFQPTPLSSQDLKSGAGAKRIVSRLEEFLANRAIGDTQPR